MMWAAEFWTSWTYGGICEGGQIVNAGGDEGADGGVEMIYVV